MTSYIFNATKPKQTKNKNKACRIDLIEFKDFKTSKLIKYLNFKTS